MDGGFQGHGAGLGGGTASGLVRDGIGGPACNAIICLLQRKALYGGAGCRSFAEALTALPVVHL